MDDGFVAGAFWTPERRNSALDRVRATMASPEFQALLAMPEPPMADVAGEGLPRRKGPVRREACRFRRGRATDVPRMAELIARADLAPLFIEEFVEGFVAVEHEGVVIGCGGLELYGECGIIRSVVVDEVARGLALGKRMAQLLMDDARLSSATDIYLFTLDAHAFWLALGFRDVALDAWKLAARENWQYQFISTHPEISTDIGVHSMWKPA